MTVRHEAAEPGGPSADDPVPPDLLVLPPGAERTERTDDRQLGAPGRPFDRGHPFFVGLSGAAGVAVAYTLYRGIADVGGVVMLVGLALFIAVGLNPVIVFLMAHRCSRGLAVAVVTLGFVAVVGAFVVIAVPPITHEFHVLVTNEPRYRSDLVHGRGWAGRLAVRLHLTGYLTGRSTLRVPVAGGLLGAGRVLLSVGVATTTVVALTVYFLIALPGVERLWLSLIARSRRRRVELLTDEIFERVGGYLLGNLLTSLVSAVGTYLWLVAFGVPYALLLALLVAVFDLIPMVGSTIAGVVVSLVALSRGLPVAVATAAFYIVYRFVEDYLLNPRIMQHTVKVSPGLTIIATLIGGSLLGIVGALIAIPVAAAVHLLLQEVAVPRQDGR